MVGWMRTLFFFQVEMKCCGLGFFSCSWFVFVVGWWDEVLFFLFVFLVLRFRRACESVRWNSAFFLEDKFDMPVEYVCVGQFTGQFIWSREREVFLNWGEKVSCFCFFYISYSRILGTKEKETQMRFFCLFFFFLKNGRYKS